METIVGLVPDDVHVAEAKQEMKSAGFDENAIRVLRKPDDVWNLLGGHKKSRVLFRNVAIGAIFGLVLGILYGTTTGYCNCTLMACPVGSSMICLVLIVLFCTFVGGFFSALISLGQLDRSLYSYVEGVRHGQILLVVEASRENGPKIQRILEKAHGKAIQVIHEEAILAYT